MAILSLPSSPGIRAARFVLQGTTQSLVSPLTRTVQTVELLAARWMATYTLPPMTRTQASAWIVFLARCQGRAGRFYAGDPSATTPRGTATGTPLVNGADQAGKFLVTDGWTAGVTGILALGDYVAWDTPSGWRELHKLTAAATSDGGGNATLTLTPPIREAPADNATLIISAPTCVMLLATDEDGAWSVDDALIHDVTFNAEEAFAPSVERP